MPPTPDPDPTVTRPPDANPSRDAGSAAGPGGSLRYALGDEIARGGMGVVCRATDTVLGREVAVKLLHHKYAAGSDAARRFRTEARITGRLQHPGVPPVHDLGTLPDGRPFLAMKLIRGRTLADELADRRDPAHDRGRFVAAFAQVCQVVAYAHAHRVIHRDLKPLNVMVGAFGDVQVMDWGLAKELDAAPPGTEPARPAATAADSLADPNATTGVPTADSSADPNATTAAPEDEAVERTRAGSVMGTPGYMPPEQARGDVAAVDRRADVFALGAMLWEVLTGAPPYGRDSTAVVLARATAGVLGPAFEQLDGCGAAPDLVALCKRCLSANPANRPADAGAGAAALAEYQAAAEERARRAEVERMAEALAAFAAHADADGEKVPVLLVDILRAARNEGL